MHDKNFFLTSNKLNLPERNEGLQEMTMSTFEDELHHRHMVNDCRNLSGNGSRAYVRLAAGPRIVDGTWHLRFARLLQLSPRSLSWL
jgi:hypothetical protein